MTLSTVILLQILAQGTGAVMAYLRDRIPH